MSAPDEAKPQGSTTTAERTSDRELLVTRRVNGPVHLVYQAWTKPDLFVRWWAPKSFGVSVISCDLDVRTGGGYKLEMGHPSFDKPMTFFGRYIDVVPDTRIVWTNEEGGEAGPVTTVTFSEREGVTLVTVHELYPTKEALDEAIASGSTSGWGEQFTQLDALILGAA